MHKCVATLSSLLLAGVVTAYQSGSQPPEKAVGNKVDIEPGLSIEALGACSYDVERVQCWDMAGKPAPEIKDSIEAYYLTNTGNQLSFRLRRKNRILVFRAKGPNAQSYSIQMADGGYANGADIYGGNAGPSLKWIYVAADKDEKTAAVIVQAYGQSQHKSTTIPFRNGEKTTFEGVQIEVGSWEAAKPAPVNQVGSGFGTSPVRKGKQWAVVLGTTSEPNAANVAIFPVDASGRPIQYVDDKGNPVSPTEFLRTAPKDPGQFGYNPPAQANGKYQMATFSPGSPSIPGAATYYTNVNPQKITSLSLVATRQHRVLFEGIPLDPQP